MDSIENINQNYRNQFFDTQRPEPKNEMDKETFLTLFIEGLKNQDPTEPMEHSEMMAQMTNLALMESVSTMKRSIEEFTRINNGASTNGIVEYSHLIGKKVKIENSEGKFEGVVQSVGKQMNENVLELDNGEFYLVDTIVGIYPND